MSKNGSVCYILPKLISIRVNIIDNMELTLREFQLIEINRTIIERYSNRKYIENFNHRTETHTDYLKLNHLKKQSLKDFKKVEKKLQSCPYFLKSKKIREEVGREAFIKSEYGERWDTYKNTNRMNLSRFLKDMLPYIDKYTMKRLKHGKYFRKIVDGLMRNENLLSLAKTPNSYAVLNPEKTRDFYTEDILKDLGKKFDKKKLVDLTKDKKLIEDILEKHDLPETTISSKGKKKKRGHSTKMRSQFYYSQSVF